MRFGARNLKAQRHIEVKLVFRQGRTKGGCPMMVADVPGWDFSVQVGFLSDIQVQEGERWRCRLGCGAWVWPVARVE